MAGPVCVEPTWTDGEGRGYIEIESDSQILRHSETLWRVSLPKYKNMNGEPVAFPDFNVQIQMTRMHYSEHKPGEVKETATLKPLFFADAGAQKQHARHADMICYVWKNHFFSP